MSKQISIVAEVRTDAGKGASRRLRRTGKVPGILYGADADPVQLTLDANVLAKELQNEAFFSQVLSVSVAGTTQAAVVRDIQRHPAKGVVMHIDFLRISADRAIEVHVPLHFINEDKCVGVKVGGGSLSHNLAEITVSALPSKLPEYIEVDVENLDVGKSLHLSHLNLPEGVSIPELAHGHDHDLLVVAVHAPRGGSTDSAGS
ncbi:MAG: 50S ribosomal protein L25/general stress protein Ctc [Pseudomonadales bacterium]|nr:50S ribosomal protein L25/general stress protein Ctc [Pseudomonadales bacterium]